MGTLYLVGFLRLHAHRGALEEVLLLAGEVRSADELAEDTTWSSYAQFRALFEAAGVVLCGQRRLADVGLGAWDFGPKSNPEWLEMLRTLGSPGQVFANSGAYSSMWPLLHVVGEEVGPTEWVMRHSLKEGFAPFKEFCWFFAGLHAISPKVFGFPTGDVVEEACQCDGAPACVFRVRWEAVGDERIQAEASRRQVQMLEGRLEALQRTVAEIVAGEDIGLVLGRIAAAAARAVPAPAYVLALQARGSPTPRVYSVGLAEADAARIGAELLADDDRGAARRLTVNIASKRRSYGRLAAISREDNQFMPEELVTLVAYSRLAAAALDSATALDEARALTVLSTSLAQNLSVKEAAAKIAAAVPTVIDCDRGAVVVIDPTSGTARIVATSGYPAAVDARLRSRSMPAPATSLQVAPSAYRASVDLLVERLLAGTGSVAMVAAPIAVDEEEIGWLVASVTALAERLLADDVAEDLVGLAGQAATAFGNRRLLDQIRHQALHDALTGLPNRTLILDRVDQMLARARRQKMPGAAMFIDLDGFKDINDTYGHAAGDQLLQAVASRLVSALRASDTVGRLGGDEFVVLLEGVSLIEGPGVTAQRLLEALHQPYNLLASGRPLIITASIGIAAGDRVNADELLRDADVALYRAKAAGKGCYQIFAPGMHTPLHLQVELNCDLRTA